MKQPKLTIYKTQQMEFYRKDEFESLKTILCAYLTYFSTTVKNTVLYFTIYCV
jgi:hypothetical protein